MSDMPNWRENSSSDDELIAAALCYYAAPHDDDDMEDSWRNPVIAFYDRATPENVARAVRLIHSTASMEREVGVDILNRIIQALRDRQGDSPELVEISRVLFDLLDVEQDVDVCTSIIAALGHLQHVTAYRTEVVTTLQRWYQHKDADVRQTVASALWAADDARAVAMLLQLMTDEDPDVRDWATFGVGSQSDADSPEIRAALAARLDDAHPIAAGEALVGLAHRGDAQAITILLRLPPFTIDDHDTLEYEALLEAAKTTADPRLLPLLEGITGDMSEQYADAVAACRSGVPRCDG